MELSDYVRRDAIALKELLDVLGIGLAATMIAALIGRAGRNLKRLAELEPAA